MQKILATPRIILLAMLFVSFLVVANLTAFKIAEIRIATISINFPAALIFFPLTYFFDDVLTEVYGFKMSRFIIWSGLLCTLFIFFCTQIAVALPASPVWDMNTNHGNAAYDLIFKGSSRILFASMIAYFFGEFLNSIVLAKLKVVTQGKYFSLRILISTMLGVGVDSIIFCNIAFWHILPHDLIWKIILTQYIFKVAYEFFMLPVTFSLTRYLKRKDQIDYFDVDTKFNPFSFSLVE